MKKVFTLVTTIFCTLTALAVDYTDQLVVSVNGESTTQQATITLEVDENGDYTLSLKNFVLLTEDDIMPVGNITVTDLEPIKTNNGIVLDTEEDVIITDGDDENMPFWMGPLLCDQLGAVPISLRAALNGDKLYAVIDIDLTEGLGQVINVQFSTPAEEDEYTAAIESVSIGGTAVTEKQDISDEEYENVVFYTASVELSSDPTLDDVLFQTASSNSFAFVEIEPVDDDFEGFPGVSDDADYMVLVGNYAADLKSAEGWIISVKVTANVNGIEMTNDGKNTIYNLNGQRVVDTAKRQVYIVKNADGKATKVLKK